MDGYWIKEREILPDGGNFLLVVHFNSALKTVAIHNFSEFIFFKEVAC